MLIIQTSNKTQIYVIKDVIYKKGKYTMDPKYKIFLKIHIGFQIKQFKILYQSIVLHVNIFFLSNIFFNFL